MNAKQPLKRHMGQRAKNAVSNTAIHLLLIIISVIWLIPFVCVLLQSFRVESTWQVGYIVPRKWGLDNYAALFHSDFKTWYLNTVVIALANAV